MIIPELIIARTIKEELNNYARTPSRLRPMLRSLTQASAEVFIQDFLRGNIYTKVVTSFPRDEASLPYLVVSLASDNEDHPTLGTLLGRGVSPAELRVADDFGYTPGQADAVEPLGGGTDLYGEIPRHLNLNSTTVRSNLGAGYTKNINISIFMDNPESTVIMYYIIKSIIFKNRMKLEKNGVTNIIMSGGDLIQERQMEPNFIYLRVLSLQVLVWETYITDETDEFDSQEKITTVTMLLDPNEDAYPSGHTYTSTLARSVIDSVTPTTIARGETKTFTVVARNFPSVYELSVDNIYYTGNFTNGITINSSENVFNGTNSVVDLLPAIQSSTDELFIASDTVPTSVKPYMYIRLYKDGSLVDNKVRYITQVVTGAGGRIFFEPSVNEGVAGARANIFSVDNIFTFEITVAANATIGPRNIMIKNNQGYTAHLDGAFDVT